MRSGVGLALMLVALRVEAHGGEDHAAPAAATVAAGASSRRVAATTEKLEAVLEVPALAPGSPHHARLYLTDWATNAPIASASVRLAISELQLDIQATPVAALGGAYEMTFTPAIGGSHSAIVTVDDAQVRDLVLLEGIVFGPVEGAAKPLPRLARAGIALAAAVLVAVAALLMLARRRGRVAAASGAIVAALALPCIARAHGGEDHSAQAARGSSTVAVMTKEAQILFAVRTVVAESAELSGTRRLAGVVQPQPEAAAEILAPHAGVTLPVEGHLVQIGERVASGQALFLLEGIIPPEERLRANTDLSDAIAHEIDAAEKVRIAEREVERATQAPDLFSRRDREQADATLASARASLDAAKRSVATLRATLSGSAGSATRTIVRAPIAGVVTEMHVALGETAPAGHRLARIVDPTRLLVRADVPETETALLSIPPGTPARIAARTNADLVIDAIFLASSGSIDPVTRTVPAFFRPAQPERLLDGMLVDLHVETGERREGIVIPASAVTNVAGHDAVFVHAQPETFEPRDIDVGLRDGERVEILAALRPGERVVVQGVARLRAALLPSGH